MNYEFRFSRQFFFLFLISFLLIFISCTPKTGKKILNKDTTQKNLQEAKILKVDALGNAYVATANTLKKYEYSPFGDTQLNYYDNKYGDISSIDVSNPFQILIWYKDFQVIQILDKHLTLLQEISLQDLGLNISAVALSGDKSIWIFDAYQYKLLKINTQKEIIFESNPITFDDKPVVAKMMIENKGFLYLLDQKIIQFDRFAKQMTTFNAVNIDDFHFYKHYFILHNDMGYSKLDRHTGAIVGLDYLHSTIFYSGENIYEYKNSKLTRNPIK